MKSMKKLVLAGLVLLASVMVLVGCDTNTGPGSTSGTDNNTGGGATVTPVTVTVTQENFADGLAQVQAKPGSTLVLGDNIFLSNSHFCPINSKNHRKATRWEYSSLGEIFRGRRKTNSQVFYA